MGFEFEVVKGSGVFFQNNSMQLEMDEKNKKLYQIWKYINSKTVYSKVTSKCV